MHIFLQPAIACLLSQRLQGPQKSGVRDNKTNTCLQCLSVATGYSVSEGVTDGPYHYFQAKGGASTELRGAAGMVGLALRSCF